MQMSNKTGNRHLSHDDIVSPLGFAQSRTFFSKSAFSPSFSCAFLFYATIYNEACQSKNGSRSRFTS